MPRRTISLEELPAYYQHTALAANLYGQRCELSRFKRNHGSDASARAYDELVEGVGTLSEAELSAFRIRHYAQYHSSGRFTKLQLTNIFRTLVLEWTFHRIAAMDDISVQAVSESFFGNKHGQGGILRKAPDLHDILCSRDPHLRTREELNRATGVNRRSPAQRAHPKTEAHRKKRSGAWVSDGRVRARNARRVA
jgi:hypothetical protein